MNKKLFNTKEASVYLNLSINTIYKMTSNKSIPFVKLGSKCFFTLEQLNNFITRNIVEVIG